MVRRRYSRRRRVYRRRRPIRKFKRRFRKRITMPKDCMCVTADVVKPVSYDAAKGWAPMTVNWEHITIPGGAAAAQYITPAEAVEWSKINTNFKEWKITYVKMHFVPMSWSSGVGETAVYDINVATDISDTLNFDNLAWANMTKLPDFRLYK